jgi:hypothetical protein
MIEVIDIYPTKHGESGINTPYFEDDLLADFFGAPFFAAALEDFFGAALALFLLQLSSVCHHCALSLGWNLCTFFPCFRKPNSNSLLWIGNFFARFPLSSLPFCMRFIADSTFF